jgi:hypothetical protein
LAAPGGIEEFCHACSTNLPCAADGPAFAHELTGRSNSGRSALLS